MKYQSQLTLFETQVAIKKLKDFFEKELAFALNLTRVSAPLFVLPESGLNDNLNGVEQPVSFPIFQDKKAEIVHSLAKWKRMALYKYQIKEKNGIYTDMNAIRKDETLSPIHSYYVDQWDWERVMPLGRRHLDYLKHIVSKIYAVMKMTDTYIALEFPALKEKLPKDIYFITSQALEDLYPHLSPKERENEICKKHLAVCIMQIGSKLSSGFPHDLRAPDYDDWQLNADILVYHPTLDCGLELSSMGIRVDPENLVTQLTEKNVLNRLSLDYHHLLVKNMLPQTIGGGIGQSRLCMFYLEKAHIGEVQCSLWPDDMIKTCESNNIHLL
jgi:aspartate--ammonia ligase